VDVHVTTIKRSLLNFARAKILVLNSYWWTWATHRFYQKIAYIRILLSNSHSGVQRSSDARATASLDAPLPNPSIEQWRMVVIGTGYKLFVTSQYDVKFTFANQRFSKVC